MSARLLGAKKLAEKFRSACPSPSVFPNVLAARMTKLITARARKNIRTARRPFDTPRARRGMIVLSRSRNIYMLFAGRSVLGKTVPEVLSTARGRGPRAVLKTEGTVLTNTDRPRPANNVFIFFFRRVLCKQFSNLVYACV